MNLAVVADRRHECGAGFGDTLTRRLNGVGQFAYYRCCWDGGAVVAGGPAGVGADGDVCDDDGGGHLAGGEIVDYRKMDCWWWWSRRCEDLVGVKVI